MRAVGRAEARWRDRDTPCGTPTASTRSTGPYGARSSGGSRTRRSGPNTSTTGCCTWSGAAPTDTRRRRMSSEPCGQANPSRSGGATSRHGCGGLACKGRARLLALLDRPRDQSEVAGTSRRARRAGPMLLSAELDVFEGFGTYGGYPDDLQRRAPSQFVRMLRRAEADEQSNNRPARHRCVHAGLAHLRSQVDRDRRDRGTSTGTHHARSPLCTTRPISPCISSSPTGIRRGRPGTQPNATPERAAHRSGLGACLAAVA